MQINAIGTNSASQPLGAMAITRREPGPDDVQIAIDYCGVCHSDVHQARSEWAGTLYPCVPSNCASSVSPLANAFSSTCSTGTGLNGFTFCTHSVQNSA